MTRDPDASTRDRILAATAEVLGRNGTTRMSLSEVAGEAGVSRPTLYRWFASKPDLLDALVVWERERYAAGIAAACAGLPRHQRLDAALRTIVSFQQSEPGLRMVDVEPAHVIGRLSAFIPLMRQWLERLIPGPDSAAAAATVTRVAMAHYLVVSDDADQFLAQLRHAAGIKPAP